jgi:arylsulfatase
VTPSGREVRRRDFLREQGKPVFLWNLVDLERIKWAGAEALAPGRHTVEFDFKYSGIGTGTLEYNNVSGLAQSGTGIAAMPRRG